MAGSWTSVLFSLLAACGETKTGSIFSKICAVRKRLDKSAWDWRTLFTWLWRWLPLRLRNVICKNSFFQNYSQLTRRTTATWFKSFTKSCFCFSADMSVQLKAIWTWLSFFCCSLGPTSTLETKTTSLHFSVKWSNCFPVHVVHTRLLPFSALKKCQEGAQRTVLFRVYYCLCL